MSIRNHNILIIILKQYVIQFISHIPEKLIGLIMETVPHAQRI